jgi:hypothetical protein
MFHPVYHFAFSLSLSVLGDTVCCKLANACLYMQGVVRAIRSLNSRPAVMQMPVVCIFYYSSLCKNFISILFA